MKIRRTVWIAVLLTADIFMGMMVWLLYKQPEEIALSASSNVKTEITEVKRIALTFDDGPNHLYTLPLLEGLRNRGVKATFFLLGQEVSEKPDIAKKIAQDGHLIGNHSFYHVDLSEVSSEEALLQVSRTNEVIYEATGQYPQLIRPPFGRVPKDLVYEPPMVEALWTIDSRDWELSDVGTIMQNVIPYAEEDAVILMHDSSQYSVQAALALIDCLQEKGYTFVTLDEILFD